MVRFINECLYDEIIIREDVMYESGFCEGNYYINVYDVDGFDFIML